MSEEETSAMPDQPPPYTLNDAHPSSSSGEKDPSTWATKVPPPQQHHLQPPPTHTPIPLPPAQQAVPGGVYFTTGYSATQPTTVIIAQPLHGTAVGPFPERLVCPYCERLVVTSTSFQAGSVTWIWCFFLWMFTCFLCWIPFICPSCLDVRHYCPNCNKKLGEHRRL